MQDRSQDRSQDGSQSTSRTSPHAGQSTLPQVLQVPFLSIYGSAPLVVLTEKLTGQDFYLASVASPPRLGWHGAGRSWFDAHWDLFNSMIQEYAFLRLNRSRLGPHRLADLIRLEQLALSGTLTELNRILTEGFSEAS